MRSPFLPALVTALIVLAAPGEALAYVGPGAGLGVIGAALAFVVGIVLAIVGFIWYPIKRLLRARSKKQKALS